jgi:thioredoxin 2
LTHRCGKENDEVMPMSESLVVCSGCGGVNRVPSSKSAADGKCGKCGARLFDGHPADVSRAVFDKQVSRSTIPVLVDVWAPWCGPCKMMAPAFEAASRQLEPRVRLIKLNSDVQQAAAAALGIRSIPTLILFAGGKEVARQAGAMSQDQIVQWVETVLPEG